MVGHLSIKNVKVKFDYFIGIKTNILTLYIKTFSSTLKFTFFLKRNDVFLGP